MIKLITKEQIMHCSSFGTKFYKTYVACHWDPLYEDSSIWSNKQLVADSTLSCRFDLCCLWPVNKQLVADSTCAFRGDTVMWIE